ncbi:MAG TPA: type I restriction endonuclease, partial [Solirubrobacterales bacterium]|nr:type I restriction endonuclease [Solirubrobacterales bacterium]
MTPPSGHFKEDFYAEQPTLQWLAELGWEVRHGPDLGPDGSAPERDSWRDVVLIDRLRSAVAGLNPMLPDDAIEQVVQQVLTTTSPNVIEDHASFHRLLVDQVPVTYQDVDGVERSDRARLVDFERPQANDFLALNQFTVIVGSKNRRPD